MGEPTKGPCRSAAVCGTPGPRLPSISMWLVRVRSIGATSHGCQARRGIDSTSRGGRSTTRSCLGRKEVRLCRSPGMPMWDSTRRGWHRHSVHRGELHSLSEEAPFDRGLLGFLNQLLPVRICHGGVLAGSLWHVLHQDNVLYHCRSLGSLFACLDSFFSEPLHVRLVLLLLAHELGLGFLHVFLPQLRAAFLLLRDFANLLVRLLGSCQSLLYCTKAS